MDPADPPIILSLGDSMVKESDLDLHEFAGKCDKYAIQASKKSFAYKNKFYA